MDGERGDLIVRTLRADDLARLVTMDEDLSGRRRSAWYETKLDRALKDSDVCISLGAEIDSMLVGALMGAVNFGEYGLPEPVAILDTLLVDGEFGRQGIAKSLMEQLLKNLHALRISCLRTEVAWDQVDLISFFGKVGFRPAHRLVLELDPMEGE